MIEDVYEPLDAYAGEFRGKFLRLAQEKFQELSDKSGVDIEANRRQVALVESLEAKLKRVRVKMFWAILGLILGFGAAAVAGWALYSEWVPEKYFAHTVGGIAVAVVLAVWLCCICGRLRKAAAALEEKVAAAKAVAWEQMSCLNRLYTWDIPVRLIEATVPRLQFDPYFAAKRLADLSRLYGWDDSFNEGKSVCFAQSGVINGNPFVFGDCREQDWKTETYTGTKSISWTERERGSDGKMHTVTRYETLTATVEAPKPVYSNRKFLLYGNDAAPNLTFVREPSSLSGEKKGFFKELMTKRKIGKLKAFSQNLEDESQYTLMGNHEFEALFETMNRDNEVEYRLLFTPIAQVQMLKLLRDTKVGYGDDFTFLKDRKVNMIFADHLDAFTLDTNPDLFRDWNYDRAARNFVNFNTRYFKSLYFAFAPLLAIPLYQQTRTHEEIWKGVVEPGDVASFWEHEAIANFFGDEKFKHPQCITDNILKTRLLLRNGDVSDVAVTAHGFRGEERVTYKDVRGGDGRYHSVAVKWIEYLPVERTSNIRVSEATTASATFKACFDKAPARAFRRTIRAYFNAMSGS